MRKASSIIPLLALFAAVPALANNIIVPQDAEFLASMGSSFPAGPGFTEHAPGKYSATDCDLVGLCATGRVSLSYSSGDGSVATVGFAPANGPTVVAVGSVSYFFTVVGFHQGPVPVTVSVTGSDTASGDGDAASIVNAFTDVSGPTGESLPPTTIRFCAAPTNSTCFVISQPTTVSFTESVLTN